MLFSAGPDSGTVRAIDSPCSAHTIFYFAQVTPGNDTRGQIQIPLKSPSAREPVGTAPRVPVLPELQDLLIFGGSVKSSVCLNNLTSEIREGIDLLFAGQAPTGTRSNRE